MKDFAYSFYRSAAWKKCRQSYIDKRLQIEQSIDAVADADQREVLERRYLFYQRWVGKFNKESGEYIMGITDYMNYSERTIYKIHGEALKHIVVPKECSEMQ